ncbi:MAG: RHS repeat-associated core domain-containing protein, partial [Bacteroidota bacterium]
MAGENGWRFSTKYFDAESDLGYWGRRYYHPDIGRWASRDPMEEEGGDNLYLYTGNDPSNRRDPDGRCTEGETMWLDTNVRHKGGNYTGNALPDVVAQPVVKKGIHAIYQYLRCYCERENFEVRYDHVEMICRRIKIPILDSCGLQTGEEDADWWSPTGRREDNLLSKTVA